jgi:hypothetical protein
MRTRIAARVEGALKNLSPVSPSSKQYTYCCPWNIKFNRSGGKTVAGTPYRYDYGILFGAIIGFLVAGGIAWGVSGDFWDGLGVGVAGAVGGGGLGVLIAWIVGRVREG